MAIPKKALTIFALLGALLVFKTRNVIDFSGLVSPVGFIVFVYCTQQKIWDVKRSKFFLVPLLCLRNHTKNAFDLMHRKNGVVSMKYG